MFASPWNNIFQCACFNQKEIISLVHESSKIYSRRIHCVHVANKNEAGGIDCKTFVRNFQNVVSENCRAQRHLYTGIDVLVASGNYRPC